MDLKSRFNAFVKLGELLDNFQDKKNRCLAPLQKAVETAMIYNGWFTKNNVNHAIMAIAESIRHDKLQKWVEKYNDSLDSNHGKSVAVIMAGNIPLVGFHDFICVLISGNAFIGKLSSKDEKLLPEIAGLLKKIEPRFSNMIRFENGKLHGFDSVIATGSSNTSRYFDYYFGKYANIIRKNRNSVAVLNGKESDKELNGLADDVFLYFGLGCRNVSKIFIPPDYDFNKLFGALYNYKDVINNNKYANNYDYNRVIFLMNNIRITENGFLLLKEDKATSSQIAVLNYEYYNSKKELSKKLKASAEDIQCIVADDTVIAGSAPFGKSQKPELWDYADGVDTMEFLFNIHL